MSHQSDLLRTLQASGANFFLSWHSSKYQVGCGCEQSWLHCQSWRCSRLCWLHLVGHGRRRGIQALLCEPHPRFRSQSHGGAQQRRLEARIIQTIEKNANETAPSLVSLACVYENGIALTAGPPLPTPYGLAYYTLYILRAPCPRTGLPLLTLRPLSLSGTYSPQRPDTSHQSPTTAHTSLHAHRTGPHRAATALS
jgi:hypothetical protein